MPAIGFAEFHAFSRLAYREFTIRARIPRPFFDSRGFYFADNIVKFCLLRIQNFCVYLVARLLICVVQALPIELCHAGARFLAFLMADVLRLRHKVTDGNLQIANPTWTKQKRKQVIREMWEHLLLMICEIAHVPRKIHETNWRDFIDLKEGDRLVGGLLDNRGCVLVSAHFGNFEVGGYIASLLGFKTHTVARELDNPFLDQYVNDWRSSKGQHILPKDGSGADAQNVLENGGTLLLLGDQHAGPKGCWVDFMGRPASCHKALAVFTLIGGAPQVITYTKRAHKPMRFEIGVPGVADPATLPDEVNGVKELTQWYNDRLAEMIRKSPAQYWWVHRRWKGEPPQRKRRKPKPAASDAATSPSEKAA